MCRVAFHVTCWCAPSSWPCLENIIVLFIPTHRAKHRQRGLRSHFPNMPTHVANVRTNARRTSTYHPVCSIYSKTPFSPPSQNSKRPRRVVYIQRMNARRRVRSMNAPFRTTQLRAIGGARWRSAALCGLCRVDACVRAHNTCSYIVV